MQDTGDSARDLINVVWWNTVVKKFCVEVVTTLQWDMSKRFGVCVVTSLQCHMCLLGARLEKRKATREAAELARCRPSAVALRCSQGTSGSLPEPCCPPLLRNALKSTSYSNVEIFVHSVLLGLHMRCTCDLRMTSRSRKQSHDP